MVFLFSEHFLDPLVERTSDLLILTQGQLWSVDGCPDLARRVYRSSPTPGWDGRKSTWYVHEGTCVIAATGRDGCLLAPPDAVWASESTASFTAFLAPLLRRRHHLCGTESDRGVPIGVCIDAFNRGLLRGSFP